jgi:HEPN domain-containing protein
MRHETEPWWRQATAELHTAQVNLDSDQYYAASWFCQQASEKALKALYIERTGVLAPKIHDLVRLGDLLDAPAEVKPGLATLNDVLTIVRYPDFADIASASSGSAPHRVHTTDKFLRTDNRNAPPWRHLQEMSIP